MRRTVFLATMSLMCVLGVSGQQLNIDTQKSTLARKERVIGIVHTG
jgi:hypothetical protein